MRCELLSKRGNSGFRRGTLRFDPVEVRLCLGELGDERVTRRGRRDIRKLFVGGRFHCVGGNAIPRVAASSTALQMRRPQLELKQAMTNAASSTIRKNRALENVRNSAADVGKDKGEL